MSDSAHLLVSMTDADTAEEPLVTVVTPTLQTERFISATIESVMKQDYPKIEYIVMDGGSTDGTLDVLRSYERKHPRNIDFRWFSSPDKGTSDAINNGLARAQGSVLGYLNADDTYAPGAIRAAVEALTQDPAAQGVYGDADWISEQGSVIGRYPTHAFVPEMLQSECFICQPASFIRREAFFAIGGFDASLQFGYDYDFWIRFSKQYRLIQTNRVLAASRMYVANKTLGKRRSVLRENIVILKRHFGFVRFRHVLAYAAHVVDGRDQFFAPFQPSISKYLLSLPLGVWFNRAQPVRYFKEWGSAMSLRGLRNVVGRR